MHVARHDYNKVFTENRKERPSALLARLSNCRVNSRFDCSDLLPHPPADAPHSPPVLACVNGISQHVATASGSIAEFTA
jgi:hypothetical protein